ncbi:regulatory protein RecX [Bifidobacterium felsineum]|uniref:Regulatory protein RecX n=1 Tax=Bifidobacterium felsineum TaxID=2045440 RepID=A0A2M9HJW3_9BIFI|nr:regulatory protein RecX [Bifidobacterium felsineum]MBT1164083.1 regulatory protein RecX [Bifidobacterium felsineum]PJM77104.1 RecX family transcriptional regulator [Bifidobacterium felsineum]
MISAEAFLQHNPVVLQDGESQGPQDDRLSYVEAGESRSRCEEHPHAFKRGGRTTRVKANKGKTSLWNSRSAGSATVENPDDGDACREAALRLLDAAPRSSGALRDRLIGKGYAEHTVDGVIDRLIAVHLINDLDYAQSVVRICANRMMGRRGTMMELARKGVDHALATQVADEAERNGVFEEAAWELGRRVAHKTEGLERQVRQRRFWSAGGRKGHNPATLREVAEALLV